MKEVKARDWIVIWVVSENDENKNLYDDVIEIPNTSLELTPFTISIALDLFAYFTANHLWREIDKPRNLAKSVTVE
jgi:glucosamine--fructose-6-phosphate aminotransferase (isomerizing)